MDGIKLNRPPDDRLDRMIADPDAYFAEARARARQMIERDIARARERDRAAAPWWKRWLL